jgi:4-hydroxy-2-oxoheptanedioate aldolase
VRKSRIRAKLAQNLPVLVTTLHFCDPSVFELASLMGFDGIWIDLEHHAHSLETAQNLMRAARVGQSDIVARPANGEMMRMGRILEAGAQGIMYPRCSNAEEAAEVVKWAKFPPLGKRGIDGGNPDMPYLSMPLPQYLREANEQTFLVIQVEEQAALEHVEKIAAVDGVDVIMLGPGDFSALEGFPGEMGHPELVEATDRIAAAAKKHGKHWGRPVASVEEAQRYIAKGARFLPHGSDIGTVKKGLEQIQADFSALGFSFDNQFTNGSAASNHRSHPHFAVAGSKAEAKRLAN